MIFLIATMLVGASASDPAMQILKRVDQSFVCPESLPNDAARDRANEQFIKGMASAVPNLTVSDVVVFRMAMLRQHKCVETLKHIESQQ